MAMRTSAIKRGGRLHLCAPEYAVVLAGILLGVRIAVEKLLMVDHDLAEQLLLLRQSSQCCQQPTVAQLAYHINSDISLVR